MNDRKTNLKKQENIVSSLDDAVAALQYYTGEYPVAAVEFIINHKTEATPMLLEFLRNTLENHEILDDNYFGHIHAMFILSQFREKQAFNYVIGIASLPDNWPETLLGDAITEDLHNILASVYDDNLQKIKHIIEDQSTNTWSRDAALKSLLVLVKEGVLERKEIISYLKTLFRHRTFINDIDATTHLVNTACDLYPKEMYKEISEAFQNDLVDDWSVDMKWVDEVLALGENAALQRYLYGYKGYGFIDDVVTSVQCWACFTNKGDAGFLPENYDFSSASIPFHRDSPRVGRNDPCPCGSGKKFKKCCLH